MATESTQPAAAETAQPEAAAPEAPGAVAAEAAALAPTPDGAPAPDEDDEPKKPSIVDDFEDLADRIARSQGRIKNKADGWVKRATSGNLAALTRDALADEVLQLMKEMAEMCADFGESFEKLDRVVDDMDYEMRKQGQAFREFVSGSVIAYSVVLAQMILAREKVDDEMRLVAQKILDSMGAVNAAAGRQVVSPGAPQDGAAAAHGAPDGHAETASVPAGGAGSPAA